MPLESATYLDTLNVSNPASTDQVSQADDHIRMLKSVLKSTFPNITGPVTSSQRNLNNGLVPVGLISMWSGDPATLPSEWKLCDGGTYAKSDGSGNITAPDLRNRFVLAAGGSTGTPATSPTVGTTGGASSATPTITVAGSALTQAQLPNCSFTVTDPGHGHTATVTDPGHNHSVNPVLSGNFSGGSLYYSPSNAGQGSVNTSWGYTGVTVSNSTNTTGVTVASGGSGNTHDHTATSSAVAIIPPYYVLAFIIKV